MTKIRFLILFCIIFISAKSDAQLIYEISANICDSINSTKYVDSVSLDLSQARIYSNIVTKNLLKLESVEIKKISNDYNAFNYKLIQDLNKNCPAFKIKSLAISPLTNLIEVDSLFSLEQNKNIKELAREIRTKNRMEVLILSIDDFFPDKNIDDFTVNKLIEWKIGTSFEKGGTMIVINKNLKIVKIVTTEIAMKYLNNKDCDNLIINIMVPNFKKQNYYDGIYKSLIDIQKILNKITL